MKVIRDLVAHFANNGWLAPVQSTLWPEGSTPPLIDPIDLIEICDSQPIGSSFLVCATGTSAGCAYGSGIYSPDSDIGFAAVHAGILRVGQTGLVKLTIVAPPPTFRGRTRNGVRSRSRKQGGFLAYLIEGLAWTTLRDNAIAE